MVPPFWLFKSPSTPVFFGPGGYPPCLGGDLPSPAASNSRWITFGYSLGNVYHADSKINHQSWAMFNNYGTNYQRVSHRITFGFMVDMCVYKYKYIIYIIYILYYIILYYIILYYIILYYIKLYYIILSIVNWVDKQFMIEFSCRFY